MLPGSTRPSDRYLRGLFTGGVSRHNQIGFDDRGAEARRETQEEIRNELSRMEWLGKWFVGVISLSILIFALGVSASTPFDAELLKSASFFVSFAFIILFCSTTIGGFLGFLFAIPRLLQRSPHATEVKSASETPINAKPTGSNYLLSNSNLEEISDWLTKIIVGLGLIHLTNIIDMLGRYQDWLGKSLGEIPKAPPTSPFLVVLSITGLVLGFLFFYLQTRTRITLLLLATERARDENRSLELSAESQQTRVELGLRSGPQGNEIRKGGQIAPAQPVATDPDVLRTKPDASDDAERWAAWAGANARQGRMDEALRAWEIAIEKRPDKAIYYKQLADVYRASNRHEDALQFYETAIKRGEGSREVLKSQLGVALYVEGPEATQIAIRNAELLHSDPYMRKDPWIGLWRVVAYAQRFAELPANSEERAQLREIIKDGLEEIIAIAPNPKSSVRTFLRQLLEPGFQGGDPSENDLDIFQDDEEIANLIRGGSKK
jgi:tetratricopeptide (TPR) repeat protein